MYLIPAVQFVLHQVHRISFPCVLLVALFLFGFVASTVVLVLGSDAITSHSVYRSQFHYLLLSW